MFLRRILHSFIYFLSRHRRMEIMLSELKERIIHIEDRETELITRTTNIEAKENELINQISQLKRQEDDIIAQLAQVKAMESLVSELKKRMIHVEDKETELITRIKHREDKENKLNQDILKNRETIEVGNYCLAQQIDNMHSYTNETKNIKVHFIRCIDIYNQGDLSCQPLDYFPAFKQNFTCYLHTIKSVNYSLIQPGDWIIIGGGGMFDCNKNYQAAINKILSMPVKVVSWAVGHNNHIKGCMYYSKIDQKIAYHKFYILTTRDWQYADNERFMPCVSCMMPQLDKKYSFKRTVGVIEHHDIHIDEFKFDKINNSEPIELITDFIASSEVIITNSYHAAYWSLLMEKKVIIYKPFSNKFSFFKYKPVVWSGNLEKDIQDAQIYKGAKEEFRTMNIDFSMELVKVIGGNKNE